MSLHESNSTFDYTILTSLVSFVSLCASLEAGLIHSLGTLTLTDIDHVRIMKSSVSPSLHTILPLTTIGQSLYTLSVLTFSHKGVRTTIGSCRTSGNISKVRASKEVKKESADPGSSKA